MKTSWKRALGFANFVSGFTANGQQFTGWLASHPGDNKFAYAIKRVLAQIQKLSPEMQARFETIDIDHCATGAHGVIIRNPDDSLAFTKEGLKKRNAARMELLNAEDIEIEPYFATQIPESLSDSELEVFSGFVIKPETVQSMLEVRESQDEMDISVPENGGQVVESLPG